MQDFPQESQILMKVMGSELAFELLEWEEAAKGEMQGRKKRSWDAGIVVGEYFLREIVSCEEDVDAQ